MRFHTQFSARRHSFWRFLPPAVLVLVLASSALAAIPQGNQVKDRSLKNALRKDLIGYLSARSQIEHISTLSLVVSFRGNPSEITLAAGTTHYNGREPVTPSNLFQIGSNTKAFTSVLILQLEAAGVLSIRDTLGTWLPEYPAWANVTIEQLLNMTSGIPTYDDTAAWEADYQKNPYRTFTPKQLVAYVYPKIKTPGGAFEYSNTGYILAQMIIDKADRSSKYEAQIQRLTSRLGLKDTFYAPDFYSSHVIRRLVSGYFVNTDDPGLSQLFGQDTKEFSLGWAQAAGGMISTPADLSAWVRDLFEGTVLPKRQFRELTSLVSIPSGRPVQQASCQDPSCFGLGVFQVNDPELGLFWGYEGSTIGYRAAYAYFPNSGLILTVFTNSQTSHAQNKLSSVLFPSLYKTLEHFGKVPPPSANHRETRAGPSQIPFNKLSTMFHPARCKAKPRDGAATLRSTRESAQIPKPL